MRILISCNKNIVINYKDIEIMQINILENQKEQKEHGSYEFPVNVSVEHIEAYEQGSFLWHWHPEIELTWVMSGEIEYHVNEHTYFLKSGEGLFGNSSTLHSGYMKDNQACSYLSITFHPRFLYGSRSSALYTKYVDFITSNGGWSSVHLDCSASWHQEVLEIMGEIYELSKVPPEDYELQVHILLMQIWQKLYHHFTALPNKEHTSIQYLERLREIISFLQKHYNDNISLDDVAASVNICKSECCRFFKKHMDMTIFDYILLLRIQNSLPLLRDGDPITKVADMVGFSSPAYYSQIFKRYMKCTPREYRKM